jgi:hypothetical protein
MHVYYAWVIRGPAQWQVSADMLKLCRSFMDSMEQHPVSKIVEGLVAPGEEGSIKAHEHER